MQSACSHNRTGVVTYKNFEQFLSIMLLTIAISFQNYPNKEKEVPDSSFTLIRALRCCITFLRIKLQPFQMLLYLLLIFSYCTYALTIKCYRRWHTSTITISFTLFVDKVVQLLRQKERYNPLFSLDSNVTPHQARTFPTGGSIALTKFPEG